MAINTNAGDNKAEQEGSTGLANPTPPKRAIYPQMNAKFQGMLIWLGLAFVVMVFLVQHFSGYS